MLIFAAFVPTNPLLIPAIGKEHLEQIKKTSAAMLELSKKIAEANPSTIIFISYPEILKDAFGIGLSEEYKTNFENFGDFSATLPCKGDAILAHQIKEGLEEKISLAAVDLPKLCHTVSVPLQLLVSNLKSLILPISICSLGLKEHFDFGKLLQEEILKTDKNVALIASGDFSHCLTKDAPGGFSEKARKFDQDILSCLQSNNTVGILNLDPELIKEVQDSGTKSLAVLLGVLDKINHSLEVLSYEGSLGIGHLVANFQL